MPHKAAVRTSPAAAPTHMIQTGVSQLTIGSGSCSRSRSNRSAKMKGANGLMGILRTEVLAGRHHYAAVGRLVLCGKRLFGRAKVLRSHWVPEFCTSAGASPSYWDVTDCIISTYGKLEWPHGFGCRPNYCHFHDSRADACPGDARLGGVCRHVRLVVELQPRPPGARVLWGRRGHARPHGAAGRIAPPRAGDEYRHQPGARPVERQGRAAE